MPLHPDINRTRDIEEHIAQRDAMAVEEEIELIEDDSEPPDTDDEDEIRKYWDTHAVTEFNSEPVPREEWPIKSPFTTFSVRIERENIGKIADLAEAAGILAIPVAEKILNRAISEAHAAKFGTSEPTERIRRWRKRVAESER